MKLLSFSGAIVGRQICMGLLHFFTSCNRALTALCPGLSFKYFCIAELKIEIMSPLFIYLIITDNIPPVIYFSELNAYSKVTYYVV